MVQFFGCSNIYKSEIIQDDPFFKLYEEVLTIENNDKDIITNEDKEYITLSALNMPLSVFCRIMSDNYKIGIVYSETLSNKKITAEFKNSDFKSVFNILSRQLNVEVVQVGNVYYLGSLRSSDRGIFVNRVLGYSKEQIKSIVSSLLSTDGKAEVLDNGLVIVSDHDTVLIRVAEALEYIRNTHINTWIIQLYFVAIRKNLLLEGGLNVTSSGSLSYNMSENKIQFDDLSIDALFNMQGEGGFSDIFNSPMLIVRDGSSGRWQYGENTPIAKYTVSDSGASTITGYDYKDTGLIVECSVTESYLGGVLTLDISISSITNYVSNCPQTDTTSLTMSCDMQSKKLYLLGELTEFRKVYSISDILNFGRDTGKVSIQVWGQIYKISGGALSTPVKSQNNDNENLPFLKRMLLEN